MKAFLALLLVAVATASIKGSEEQDFSKFQDFVAKYSKTYSSEEEFARRFKIFQRFIEIADFRNSQESSAVHGITQFADLTEEEFKDMYLMKPGFYVAPNNAEAALPEKRLGVTLDWRNNGTVITPVKNQAQCGSCWAFSTTGSVEGANQIKSGQLQSLAEQQLVDCAGSAGNQGCNGGLMDDAFEYIIKNGGIGSEASYPYTAKDGKCKQVTSVATVSKYTDVKKNDEAGLMSAVNIEPVSVAVDAQSWSSYKKGVMSGLCGKSLDHGVLAVGYGTDASQDYWLVKNSWGTSWGESGFIRLIRNKNECGIAEAASYPTP